MKGYNDPRYQENSQYGGHKIKDGSIYDPSYFESMLEEFGEVFDKYLGEKFKGDKKQLKAVLDLFAQKSGNYPNLKAGDTEKASGIGFNGGAAAKHVTDGDLNKALDAGVYYGYSKESAGNDAGDFPSGFKAGTVLVTRYSNSRAMQLFLPIGDSYGRGIAARAYDDNSQTFTSWWIAWTTDNTTVDNNGFIKSASPIVKLHNDKITQEGDFDATFEKLGTGHYKVANDLGFAKDGWTIETPTDANRNIKVFVDYWENEDKSIEVKTYVPDYSGGPASAGDPVDIPEGRWIDIRLQEPSEEEEPEE